MEVQGQLWASFDPTVPVSKLDVCEVCPSGMTLTQGVG